MSHAKRTACGAWNPGLQSELPREYVPLATIFRTENVSTGLAKAYELSDYCGLPARDLVAFRADRLIVHELLVRLTASVAVPDGSDYEDLGNNFRAIASTILAKYIAPHRDELTRRFDDLRSAAAAIIARELAICFSSGAGPAHDAEHGSRSRWSLGFIKRINRPLPPEPPEERDQRIILNWSNTAQNADDPLVRSCLRALSTIATAITARRGRLLRDKELLSDLAVTLVANDYGSEAIGEAIEPLIQEAVAREGYRPLSPQERPVIMNVKGASASGKSSMRPLQRSLAKKLELPWEEFALVSPDIWRKFLLDYGSLGAAYKYAGTLTGHELEIVDKKLDRHMALKAAKGETPHLLIDRFRFDSFAEGKESTKLLTRFGDLVYMFFMITPPEATVERAWARGLKVGRYKAVEDLLAHNVEAYTGMPELFFTWALDARRRVHYEFLDNSVPEGRPPRTVAFGWNGEMTILDIARMLDIDRFRKINIHARAPGEVYLGDDLAPGRNVAFLQRCARLIPIINFADHATGCVFARLERGAWVWRDAQKFAAMLADPDAKAGLTAIAESGGKSAGSVETSGKRTDFAEQRLHTLGAWGEAARGA